MKALTFSEWKFQFELLINFIWNEHRRNTRGDLNAQNVVYQETSQPVHTGRHLSMHCFILKE